MQDKQEIIRALKEKALDTRKKLLKLSNVSGPIHIGGDLSMADMMTALYSYKLNIDRKDPEWPDRDRFILSKGHGVASLYPTMALAGYYPVEFLKHYGDEDGVLGMHPGLAPDYGIEASTGSLGQGLSFGMGMALAGKLRGKDYRTFVLLGNGECNEGQIWECAMSAAHYGIDNLVAIVDNNAMQCDQESRTVCDMGDIPAKWRAFGWETYEVDGHNVEQLLVALSKNRQPYGKPLAVICNTIKGKGISFFEDNNNYHHVHYVTKELCEKALKDMEEQEQA